jgi:tetraprenyl-beta-curcumene synthase
VVAPPRQSHLSLASTFTGAASRYWLGVFPLLGRELRHWHERARQIPDPALRRLALVTQRGERGNYEGAVAYAVLVPRAYRARVVRAVVAFQTTYDYVDTLAEQPSHDPVANGRQLHLALLTALDPESEHPDYYEHSANGRDNGYMRALVQTCRAALRTLPSYPTVAQPALHAASMIVAYQSLNHEEATEGAPPALAQWGAAVTPPDSGLRWWEAAAGGASSMTVFALIAAAAKPNLTAAETAATRDAYAPWISALHVLLDSLVDRAKDLEHGHHNLIDHYASPAEAASRLGWIAARAVQGAESLPDGTRHALIVAAMTSFYLSTPAASTPSASSTAQPLLDSMGTLAKPTMAVLRTRRTAERLAAYLPTRPGTRPAAWRPHVGPWPHKLPDLGSRLSHPDVHPIASVRHASETN